MARPGESQQNPLGDLNPQALLKSMNEQYNYLLAAGVSDPQAYRGLAFFAGGIANKLAEAMKFDPGYSMYKVWYQQAADLNGRLMKAGENAGMVRYAQARDSFLNPAGATDDDLIAEVNDLLNKGMGLEDVVKTLMDSGRFDVSEVQRVAALVGNPNYDPAARNPDGTTPGSDPTLDALKSLFGGSNKPFEQVTRDLTDPQTEFQKGFSEFARSLATNHKGEAPNLGALSARYNDLLTQWQGAIEKGAKDGSEAPDVFKERYVNIGKSTDPQFDQTTDRFQLTTVRPKQSVADWLAQNVDPEDLYMSTEFDKRPGRSTGGFTGYVRRSNV